MEAIWDLLRLLAGTFCHQDPERTMEASHLACLMCLRCSGFHSGFLIGVLAHWASRRGPALGRPLAAAGILAILVAGLDALVWPTSNPQRFFTGLLGGMGLGTIATPLIYRGRNLAAEAMRKPPVSARHMAALAAGLALFSSLYFLGGPGGVIVLSATTVTGLAALLAVMVATALQFSLRRAGSAKREAT